MKRSLKIGLLALHWEYFDSIMPPEFRQEKETISERVIEYLSAFGEVVYEGLVTNEAAGRKHARAFRERAIDCVVVFVHMATPGSYPWEALRELDLPVLIWNAHFEASIPKNYDMPELCRKSSNVGALMLSNVLLRNGRSFEVVTGLFTDPEIRGRIESFLRASATLTLLKRARLGVVGGNPMPGYLDVEIDHAKLKREIGPNCQVFSQETWFDQFNKVADAEALSLAQELKETHQVVDLNEAELQRSARLALALEQLVQANSLDAVTINCHTSYFRHDERIGIVACLAASRLTSAGIPVACTGDVLTTVAMLIGKSFGASVLYCECDLIDYEKNVMAMANTGECDYGMKAPDTCIQLLANTHFGPGGPCGRGACHFLQIKRGPATLLGFSPNAFAKRGWSLIAAPGTIIGTIHDNLTVGNCEFSFALGPVAEAFDAWVRAGATHHGALCTGDWRREISFLAGMLQIEGSILA